MAVLQFTKMHGLGNDFVLVDRRSEEIPEDPAALAVRLCDRHFGIGADGLVFIMNSTAADLRMCIFNSDGSEAEMCGNAIRCFAKYVYERGIMRGPRFTVETPAGLIRPELIVEDGGVTGVRVDMGRPVFDRAGIPMTGPAGRAVDEAVTIEGVEYRLTSLRMGVPHTVVFVPDITAVDVAMIGPRIERHPLFPARTNANFVQVAGPAEIIVRTWERGAGLTLACGTGACAAMVAAAVNGLIGREAIAHLQAGDLRIEWIDGHDRVMMTGPAAEVFQGKMEV